jgi:hypothetical protein
MIAKMSSEELIAVLWSTNFVRSSRLGYALVFTSSRVYGGKKASWFNSCEVDFGPGGGATETQRELAHKVAEEVDAKKDFDIAKETITKILFRENGLFSRGHAIFQTPTEEVRVEVKDTSGPRYSERSNALLAAVLVEFARDRVYDEKTGDLLLDVALRKEAEKQAKKQKKQKYWMPSPY